MSRTTAFAVSAASLALLLLLVAGVTHASGDPSTASAVAEVSRGSIMPWWAWPAILFVVTFLLGIAAVLGGVGGGVLFVPIVGGFFPFHLDFVRGAGLLVALARSQPAPDCSRRAWPTCGWRSPSP
jgi:hypothetical protein